MATTSRAKKPAAATDSEPSTPAQTTPTGGAFGQVDHSFTLQAVMELQKSVGKLEHKIDSLSGSVDGMKSKVEDLVHWKHKILGGAAVLVFIGGAFGFLASKVSDHVSWKSPSTPATTPSSSPASAPVPTPGVSN